jgi:hypothetical protein
VLSRPAREHANRHKENLAKCSTAGLSNALNTLTFFEIWVSILVSLCCAIETGVDSGKVPVSAIVSIRASFS